MVAEAEMDDDGLEKWKKGSQLYEPVIVMRTG
jgi:hypothetical protein